ncbi:MAG: AraC family transcriptional regulator [Pseudomonadota bacterium]
MLTLPISLVFAQILAFMLVRLWLTKSAFSPVWILIWLCAVQAAIVAFAQHYELDFFRRVQPLGAALLPATAWVVFQTTAMRPLRIADAIHIAGPAVIAVLIALGGIGLDLAIPALFVSYGLAIMVAVRPAGQGLPLLSLGTGDVPARLWLLIAAGLVASAFSDALIVLAQIANVSEARPWIISVFTSGALLVIGLVSVSPSLTEVPHDLGGAELENAQPSEDDEKIFEALTRVLEGERLYLDPDLTLARLSRRLRIPSKKVSRAINKATGENVSRLINGMRIEVAKEKLRQGEAVTEVMLSSGFNTKSNFNREFLRITGKSPSDWRARG